MTPQEREERIILRKDRDSELAIIDRDPLASIPRIDQQEASSSSFSIWHLPLFHWKTFSIFIACIAAIVIHWFCTSELFEIPQDVALSRKNFFLAKERYLANASYWDAKQRHFTEFMQQEMPVSEPERILQHLQEAPPEVFISFLINKLRLGLDRLDHIALFPKETSASSFGLIVSKYEQGIWPLKIMLSMEMEIKIQAHHLSLTFSRLRRGSQDIALGLCWAYFGAELERMRQLELLPSQSYSLPVASEIKEASS